MTKCRIYLERGHVVLQASEGDLRRSASALRALVGILDGTNTEYTIEQRAIVAQWVGVFDELAAKVHTQLVERPPLSLEVVDG